MSSVHAGRLAKGSRHTSPRGATWIELTALSYTVAPSALSCPFVVVRFPPEEEDRHGCTSTLLERLAHALVLKASIQRKGLTESPIRALERYDASNKYRQYPQ